MIETKNLTKRFDGVFALDGVSLKIPKGVVAIVGPNGSGKTTLINLLSGLLEFDGGVVIVNGVKLERLQPFEVADLGITRTFQNVRIFEQISVLDNILVVLAKKGIISSLFEKNSEFYLKTAQQVLERVDLWEHRKKLAGHLSYGQRKLLEIARALAVDAKVFLLDEPFPGLSPKMLKVTSSIINQLKTEGKSVVLIDHNMELLRTLCDFVYVLDSGKLLAFGKPETVFKRKDVIEAYLGE